MNDNGTREKETEIIGEEETRAEDYDPRQYPDGYKEEESAESDYTVEDTGTGPRKGRYGFERWTPAALSPFLYVLGGMAFGWWAWGWVIIPVCGIYAAPMDFKTRLVALSPFIYVLGGMAFGWWAWAWIIIPICGILSAGMHKRAR